MLSIISTFYYTSSKHIYTNILHTPVPTVMEESHNNTHPRIHLPVFRVYTEIQHFACAMNAHLIVMMMITTTSEKTILQLDKLHTPLCVQFKFVSFIFIQKLFEARRYISYLQFAFAKFLFRRMRGYCCACVGCYDMFMCKCFSKCTQLCCYQFGWWQLSFSNSDEFWQKLNVLPCHWLNFCNIARHLRYKFSNRALFTTGKWV